jgi:hypothetical protein
MLVKVRGITLVLAQTALRSHIIESTQHYISLVFIAVRSHVSEITWHYISFCALGSEISC